MSQTICNLVRNGSAPNFTTSVVGHFVNTRLQVPKRIQFSTIASTNHDRYYSSKSEEHPICKQNHDYVKEWDFVKEIQNLINQKLSLTAQKQSPVIDFRDPGKLKSLMNISLSNKPAASEHQLVQLCEEVVQYSVKTGNPYFQNQFYGATDPYSLAAAFLIDSLNTNVHTYDVAPIFTLIELEVVRMCLDLVGFGTGNGILAPGGSIANMFAFALAKYRYNPDLKRTGLFGSKKLIVFTSEESHYSVIKGSAFTGIGTDQVVAVPCDSRGAMVPEELEKLVKEVIAKPDHHPFMVSATAGTTVLGGIDSCEPIADICRRYKLWMHVDACIGGTALLSKKHRHLLKGIELSDSVTWNWHKLQGAPLQTSVFLCRHEGLLKACNGAQADYLFQDRKHYDTTFDAGDASIQCGRRPEALKIWLMVKARGLDGLSDLTEMIFDRARYTTSLLENMEGMKLVLSEPNLSFVCFWIVPKSARSMPENEEFWKIVNDAAPIIKRKMVEAGFAMLTFQGLANKKLSNFYRMAYKFHPVMSYEEIDTLFKTLASFSDDL